MLHQAILSAFLAISAFAMDSTEILPAQVNSPMLRYVMVSGIDSKYTADGSVQTLNEINTIEFTSDKLVRLDANITTLVDVMNQYSQQELGTQINLGTLRIETEPTVRYFAPIYARGITDRLTLAVAVPVVFYDNKLQLTQSASNVGAVCSQFSGVTKDLPEIKEACAKLNVRVVDAVRDEIAKQGYQPIRDRKETIVGDAQLVSLWKFFDRGENSALLRSTLTLPSGEKKNPDDLADLGAFGYTAVEPVLVYNYLPFRWLRFAAKGGYRFTVPDSLEARVPKDEGDYLPGIATKEKLSRRVGGMVVTGGALNISLGESFGLAGGYEFNRKAIDTYRGGRGARYDLLARDTRSQAHKVRGGVSYDTIALYQRTKKMPPLKLEYEVTNTIAGYNVDRQIVNELSLSMFF